MRAQARTCTWELVHTCVRTHALAHTLSRVCAHMQPCTHTYTHVCAHAAGPAGALCTPARGLHTHGRSPVLRRPCCPLGNPGCAPRGEQHQDRRSGLGADTSGSLRRGDLHARRGDLHAQVGSVLLMPELRGGRGAGEPLPALHRAAGGAGDPLPRVPFLLRAAVPGDPAPCRGLRGEQPALSHPVLRQRTGRAGSTRRVRDPPRRPTEPLTQGEQLNHCPLRETLLGG